MTFIAERIHPDTWPAIHALLAPGLARAEYTTERLIDDLLSYNAQLWVYRKGGDPIAACVTELVNGPHGLTLHLRLAAGKHLREWLDIALRDALTFARRVGAFDITISGRKGWERLLARHGWKFRSVVMHLALEGAA